VILASFAFKAVKLNAVKIKAFVKIGTAEKQYYSLCTACFPPTNKNLRTKAGFHYIQNMLSSIICFEQQSSIFLSLMGEGENVLLLLRRRN
jgi:hypothetical protein